MNERDFLTTLLKEPHYGWAKDGVLVVPTGRQLAREFFSNINIFKTRKNWLTFFNWSLALGLEAIAIYYLIYFFSFKTLLPGLCYAFLWLPANGTFYIHRFGAHRAFQFKSNWARFVLKNLTIKLIPEETYVIPHQVHHKYPDRIYDPHNPQCGWAYCFFADALHYPLNRELSAEAYKKTCALMTHMGVPLNSYEQYLRLGTVSNPFGVIRQFLGNWTFWGATFYWIGGIELVFSIFGCCTIWLWGIRAFNYDGHGQGKDRRRKGVDFNADDLSINNTISAWVAGEWHSNHHLYPTSARAGFLPRQLDIAWYLVWFFHRLGLISKYKDAKSEFLARFT